MYEMSGAAARTGKEKKIIMEKCREIRNMGVMLSTRPEAESKSGNSEIGDY